VVRDLLLQSTIDDENVGVGGPKKPEAVLTNVKTGASPAGEGTVDPCADVHHGPAACRSSEEV
jgi:hypothetical protein